MIKLDIPIQFDFTDYFSKWGFGDGDGFVNVGYALRELAEECINAQFKAVKLPVQTAELDHGGIHNNCRIGFEHVGGKDNGEPIWAYTLGSGIVIDKGTPIPDVGKQNGEKLFQLCLQKAQAAFEQEVESMDLTTQLADYR